MTKNPVLRLTGVYVSILAVVCFLFSTFLYQAVSREVDSGLRNQAIRIRGGVLEIQERPLFSMEADRQETNRVILKRVLNNIILLDAVIILSGALVCYKLAERTIRPIRESSERLENFTSDASHELRTPLASIQAETEVALRTQHLSEQEARAVLQSNLEEVQNMQSLVTMLLSLARGQQTLAVEKVDIGPVLRKIASMYDAKLEVRMKKTLLLGNTQAVEKIITILVSNALRHGGDATRVQITRRSHTLYVQDSGRGIEKIDQPFIFDRFYQADKARSHKTSGLGLGLPVAKQLSVAMGGDLILSESKPGKTVFALTLPKQK